MVGPDGTGKSTTAQLLASSATAGVRMTDHYRPGLLWKRSPIATVTPHADPERSAPAAAVKVTAVFVDFALGYLGPWRRRGRTGVIVLERGWWDHVADPVRYRIPERLRWYTALLARLLPKADVVVVLGGDASSIVRRKPELSEGEVEAQLQRWVELAPRAGRRVMTVDTVTATPEQVAGIIEGAVNATARRWIAVPFTPLRNRITATVGAESVAALSVYRPNSRLARLTAPLRSSAVRFGWGRPVPVLDPVFATLPSVTGSDASFSMAAMVSTGRDRFIVGLASDGDLSAVAKVGSLDDEGLRHEAEVLERLQVTDSRVRTPAVRFAGVVDGHFVVVADAARHVGGPVVRTEIDALLTDLAELDLIHGDLTPWNLVREADGRLVVLDLEHARWGSDPGFDLCHFLVQCGALLGVGSPDEVLDDLGRSVKTETAAIVGHYCEVRRTRGDASGDEQRFMNELERTLSVREDRRRRNDGE